MNKTNYDYFEGRTVVETPLYDSITAPSGPMVVRSYCIICNEEIISVKPKNTCFSRQCVAAIAYENAIYETAAKLIEDKIYLYESFDRKIRLSAINRIRGLKQSV